MQLTKYYTSYLLVNYLYIFKKRNSTYYNIIIYSVDDFSSEVYNVFVKAVNKWDFMGSLGQIEFFLVVVELVCLILNLWKAFFFSANIVLSLTKQQYWEARALHCQTINSNIFLTTLWPILYRFGAINFLGKWETGACSLLSASIFKTRTTNWQHCLWNQYLTWC